MTGYAAVRRQTSAGELAVSLRSVNHRGLDLHFHQASELAQFENEMRAVLKQNIGRGHVEVRAYLSREEKTRQAVYNRDLLTRYVDAFRQAAVELGLSGEPDLNALLTLPGMLEENGGAASFDDRFAAELSGAMTDCVKELNTHREREARELAGAFQEEIENLEENTR